MSKWCCGDFTGGLMHIWSVGEHFWQQDGKKQFTVGFGLFVGFADNKENTGKFTRLIVSFPDKVSWDVTL